MRDRPGRSDGQRPPSRHPPSEADVLVYDSTGTVIASNTSIDVQGEEGTQQSVSFTGLGVEPDQVAITVRDDNGNSDTITESYGTPKADDVVDLGGAAEVNAGQVQFTLDNTGGFDVEVTGIRVDDIGSGPQSEISHTVNEFVAVSAPGQLDHTFTTFPSAPQPLDVNADVPAGSSRTFELRTFVKNNGAAVSMAGETIEVTIYFADGTSKSYTITV